MYIKGVPQKNTALVKGCCSCNQRKVYILWDTLYISTFNYYNIHLSNSTLSLKSRIFLARCYRREVTNELIINADNPPALVTGHSPPPPPSRTGPPPHSTPGQARTGCVTTPHGHTCSKPGSHQAQRSGLQAPGTQTPRPDPVVVVVVVVDPSRCCCGCLRCLSQHSSLTLQYPAVAAMSPSVFGANLRDDFKQKIDPSKDWTRL